MQRKSGGAYPDRAIGELGGKRRSKRESPTTPGKKMHLISEGEEWMPSHGEKKGAVQERRPGNHPGSRKKSRPMSPPTPGNLKQQKGGGRFAATIGKGKSRCIKGGARKRANV